MTKSDKERFDSIFMSCEHFKDLSDSDMLRTAGECDKLREWLEEELHDPSILQYMHFAYWLGRMEGEQKTNELRLRDTTSRQ